MRLLESRLLKRWTPRSTSLCNRGKASGNAEGRGCSGTTERCGFHLARQSAIEEPVSQRQGPILAGVYPYIRRILRRTDISMISNFRSPSVALASGK